MKKHCSLGKNTLTDWAAAHGLVRETLQSGYLSAGWTIGLGSSGFSPRLIHQLTAVYCALVG